MKLTRLRVTELRQFRAPFELADIQGGLNIFSGANEAGKSSLVRAIRAAFFERHRSTSVDDLRPYGDTAAAPLIELDFEIAGRSYRLTKSFLQKKRCELLQGASQSAGHVTSQLAGQVITRLDGVEAEDALADLLGFQFALKGASREQHWGIPGLLWIEQGAGQLLRDPVLHAADHLRRALDDSLGAVAASGGDEIVGEVRRLRDELLTGTGKPRAALLQAIDEAAALAEQRDALQQAVADYRSQVDQLRQLRQAHALDAQEQPWLALRALQATAQQALHAVAALAGDSERAQETLRQVTGLRKLLAQRLEAAAQQQQGLALRQAALAAAVTRHEGACALEIRANHAESMASTAWHAARDGLALARQEDNRVLLARQAADAHTRAAELTALLQRAAAQDQQAIGLQREAALLRMPAAELTTLRQQHQRLNELQIRQAAVATRLRVELDAGVRLQLDGEILSGQAERLLLAPTSLAIPGVGRLHIAPGGSDLAELAQEQAGLHDTHTALLQRLGLASWVDAEARAQAHARRLADAEAADKARQLLAPRGLDALRKDLDAAQARQAEASNALAQLPAASTAPTLALDIAERLHAAARQTADDANQQLQSARQALATADSQRAAAAQERDAVQALLADPQLQAELAAKRLDLVTAEAQLASLQTHAAAIAERISAARPEILQQDVQRLQRSAEQAEAQQQALERQILQLEAALAAAGAQGLEETLASVQAQSDQAQRRAAQLRRRADALDLLLGKLEQRRQALTRRLQAPLQQRMDHYLGLLFPAGSLQVDAQLVPGTLTRQGPRGPETGDVETLSFGAREQMGVISRLAYADLLQAAGRPTLIILDDALVHSDEERLQQMKRVLFDAAQRHQVLLFTCHPRRWRDMGVPLRALHSEAATGALTSTMPSAR